MRQFWSSDIQTQSRKTPMKHWGRERLVYAVLLLAVMAFALSVYSMVQESALHRLVRSLRADHQQQVDDKNRHLFSYLQQIKSLQAKNQEMMKVLQQQDQQLEKLEAERSHLARELMVAEAKHQE